MDLEKIASIISVVLSALATIIATLKKNTKSTTIEEIEAREEAKKQKRIAKACKKNKIEVDTTTKSENSQVVKQDTAVNIEQQKQAVSYWEANGGNNL